MESLVKLLTLGEAAELLRVPKSWIYQRTRKRGVEKIPYSKFGKYIRFEEEALRDYIKHHRIGQSLDNRYKITAARKSGRANGRRR